MTLVRYESAGRVATITMDRSAKHNALNNALCDALLRQQGRAEGPARRPRPGDGGEDRRQRAVGGAGAEKLARDAMPKGPLETVAEVRRMLDAIKDSEDLKEGVQAFRDKRKPEFRGK